VSCERIISCFWYSERSEPIILAFGHFDHMRAFTSALNHFIPHCTKDAMFIFGTVDWSTFDVSLFTGSDIVQ